MHLCNTPVECHSRFATDQFVANCRQQLTAVINQLEVDFTLSVRCHVNAGIRQTATQQEGSLQICLSGGKWIICADKTISKIKRELQNSPGRLASPRLQRKTRCNMHFIKYGDQIKFTQLKRLMITSLSTSPDRWTVHHHLETEDLLKQTYCSGHTLPKPCERVK